MTDIKMYFSFYLCIIIFISILHVGIVWLSSSLITDLLCLCSAVFLFGFFFLIRHDYLFNTLLFNDRKIYKPWTSNEYGQTSSLQIGYISVISFKVKVIKVYVRILFNYCVNFRQNELNNNQCYAHVFIYNKLYRCKSEKEVNNLRYCVNHEEFKTLGHHYYKTIQCNDVLFMHWFSKLFYTVLNFNHGIFCNGLSRKDMIGIFGKQAFTTMCKLYWYAHDIWQFNSANVSNYLAQDFFWDYNDTLRAYFIKRNISTPTVYLFNCNSHTYPGLIINSSPKYFPQVYKLHNNQDFAIDIYSYYDTFYIHDQLCNIAIYSLHKNGFFVENVEINRFSFISCNYFVNHKYYVSNRFVSALFNVTPLYKIQKWSHYKMQFITKIYIWFGLMLVACMVLVLINWLVIDKID